MYFCVGYAFYFYLTWLPIYLKEARGFTTQQAGLLVGLMVGFMVYPPCGDRDVCALCGLLTLTIDPTRQLRGLEHGLKPATTLIQSDSQSLSVENHP